MQLKSTPLTVLTNFPTTKPTHNLLQQPYNKNTFICISSFDNHSFKLNIRYNFSSCPCSPIFSSIPRALFKQTLSCLRVRASTGVPWMISIYLFALCPVANGQEKYSASDSYPCEDVQNYYASVSHLNGEALSQKLNSVIARHHPLSYKEVWDALEILDAAKPDNPAASSEIVEIYSARIVPKILAGKPEGWNREHLWPRSYGLASGPSLTDLHNIRPADANVNSSRGNKYFGECQVGTTHCMKPANKEAASDTETDGKIWAPPAQVRGDVARAVMYMAVRYGFPQSAEGSVLHLSDSPSKAKREMGLLSTLLKWNNLDPPSEEEKLRNERVCRLYQHNRNPFVDHPEYAQLIWKQACHTCDFAYRLSHTSHSS